MRRRPSSSRSVSPDGEKTSPATAIVVDDSPVCRTFLRHGLIKAGYEIVADAGTGEEALQLFATHRPTLIVIDIVLPQMDGITAAAQILRMYPDALVVMVSSTDSRQKIRACRRLGVADFILKPFSIEKVAEVARRALVTSGPASKAS